MKPSGLPFLFLLSLAIGGCGGDESVVSVGTSYSVLPAKANVAPGASVVIEAVVVEGGYTDLDVKVREGSAGGTAVAIPSGNAATHGFPLASGATYTAPTTPGTYHVDVEFLEGTEVLTTKTATFTVTAAA